MKTEQPAAHREMYRSAIAPHLTEPILAIGIFSPGGALKELKSDYAVGKAIGTFSPIVGRLYRRKKMTATSAKNVSNVVAVTAAAVHLFPIPPHPVLGDRATNHVASRRPPAAGRPAQTPQPTAPHHAGLGRTPRRGDQ